MTVIQLQHLGEERLGGLGWRWGEGGAEEKEEKEEREKNRGRLVRLCSLSVPKPFDPFFFASLSSPLLHGDAKRGA